MVERVDKFENGCIGGLLGVLGCIGGLLGVLGCIGGLLGVLGW